jgi:small subunit ribosomal protein S15
MLKKEEKTKIIEETKVHDKDTGSADVQISLLSKEIKNLLGHLKKHPKDNHSRRGLLKMVVKRRRLLNYLQSKNKRKYNNVLKNIGLAKR